MHLRKEARGSPLFSYLNGVQVVVGSNPTTPILNLLNLSELNTTVIELAAMAAAARIGFRNP